MPLPRPSTRERGRLREWKSRTDPFADGRDRYRVGGAHDRWVEYHVAVTSVCELRDELARLRAAKPPYERFVPARTEVSELSSSSPAAV